MQGGNLLRIEPAVERVGQREFIGMVARDDAVVPDGMQIPAAERIRGFAEPGDKFEVASAVAFVGDVAVVLFVLGVEVVVFRGV